MLSSKFFVLQGHQPKLSSAFLSLARYLRVHLPGPAIVSIIGFLRKEAVLAFLQTIGFVQGALRFIGVVLLAVLQAIVLTTIGHMMRTPIRQVPPPTNIAQDPQPTQQTMAREITKDEVPRTISKGVAEAWGDLKPYKSLNLKGKNKIALPELPERSDRSQQAQPSPPQPRHEGIDEEERFLADYPVPGALYSYPHGLKKKDIPGTISTIMRLSVDTVFERARLDKEAGIAFIPLVAQNNVDGGSMTEQEEEVPAGATEQTTEENEAPTENPIPDRPVPLPNDPPSPAAFSPSVSAENQSTQNGTHNGPQRPAVNPSRSWLRKVLSHRHSAPPESSIGERNKNRTVPASPSAFTRFIYKTILRSSDGAKQEFECTACFEPVKKGELVKAAVCGHVYCKPCFDQLVLIALQTEAQFPPKCCLNPFPCRTIAKYSSKSTKLLYTLKYAEYSANRVYCPFPDCGDWHDKRNISTNTVLRCKNGHDMCPNCHQKSHKRGNCPRDSDRARAEELFREEGWQKCYHCKAFVEHLGGCRHMTCNCGTSFCFVCGKRWKTCHCSDDQVNKIKQAAQTKRFKRNMREQWEARHNASSQQTIPKAPRRPDITISIDQTQPSSRLATLLSAIATHQLDVLTASHTRAAANLAESHTQSYNDLTEDHITTIRNLRANHNTQVKTLRKVDSAEYAAREKKYSHTAKALSKAGPSSEEALNRLHLERVEHRRMQKDVEARVAVLRAEQEGSVRDRQKTLGRERKDFEMTLAIEKREMEKRHEMEMEWMMLVCEERARLLRDLEEVQREAGVGENEG
ncbi:hypothetical protein QBC40DRAFT_284739 [Triangularia verruculosa]|uniref:RBR-type E3 ubiquitin transferase n=1 Tax=Triangularia verruculosa TaxID=2587418 RepID=A0AAN7AUE2_9PEZI|nr:hypothetical protein QBC40DRAFT_284739 [Triangularia verruculosa]